MLIIEQTWFVRPKKAVVKHRRLRRENAVEQHRSRLRTTGLLMWTTTLLSYYISHCEGEAFFSINLRAFVYDDEIEPTMHDQCMIRSLSICMHAAEIIFFWPSGNSDVLHTALLIDIRARVANRQFPLLVLTVVVSSGLAYHDFFFDGSRWHVFSQLQRSNRSH